MVSWYSLRRPHSRNSRSEREMEDQDQHGIPQRSDWGCVSVGLSIILSLFNLTSSPEIWRLKPIQPRGGGNKSGDKIKQGILTDLKDERTYGRTGKQVLALYSMSQCTRTHALVCLSSVKSTSHPLGHEPRWQDDVVNPWSQLHGYAIWFLV